MERAVSSSLADLAILLMPTLWCGLLTAEFFIATKAKLNASPVHLPVRYDVGRATFAVFNHVEWMLLALMVPVIVLSGPRHFPSAAIGTVGVLLLIQSMWLIPNLNARVASIIAGAPSQPSPGYLLYIGLDVAKLVLLAAIVLNESAKIMPLLVPLR